MSLSIQPTIRADKFHIGKDGKCHIEIRVIVSRSPMYIKTGKKIEPSHWDNDAARVKKTCPNAAILNKFILEKTSALEAAVIDKELLKETITKETVKVLGDQVMSSENFVIKGDDFFTYALEVLDSDQALQLFTAETRRLYDIQIDKLKKYMADKTFNKRSNLMLTDITSDWLTKYHQYLLADGDSNNYTRQAFKLIRKVTLRAYNKNMISAYPFTRWAYPSYKQGIKIYLNKVEQDGLKKILIEKKHDDDILLTTAFFLLECYSGIRHCDWHKFKTETVVKDKQFFLRATKNQEDINIPLEDYPELKWVVDYITDNNLKYSSPVQVSNRILKIIGPVAGIKKRLTTHVGRHTCATMLLEHGLSVEEVALVLGISPRIVGTYAQVTGQKLKLAFKRIGLNTEVKPPVTAAPPVSKDPRVVLLTQRGLTPDEISMILGEAV